MIQNFILLLSFVVLSIFSWIPNQDINVKVDVPNEVRAGEEFIVTLHIYKGDIESFSRYTQSLPYGLSAQRLNTANADFSFDEQRVRIIWLKLPPEDSLTVTYKVTVDPRLTGAFELAGDFAFVNENQRNILLAEPGHMINIIPDPSVAENDRIDIADFQVIALSEDENSFRTMEVVRNEPVKISAFEYSVELNVKKGDLSKFAKIEEYIPQGFRAVEGESQNGIFSFNQGVVKILWMNLPEEPQFTVSYRIVPDPGKSVDNFNASGTFSYITGNETKSIEIENEGEVSPEVADADPEVTPEDLAQLEEPEVVEPAQETTVQDPGSIVDETETDEPDPQEFDIEGNETPEAIPQEKKPVEPEEVKTEVTTTKTREAYMLDPETGVYYRVQLAAGHRQIKIDRYFKRYNIQDEVKMEFHEGWRKYTTGSFDLYKNARDYRNRIWETTTINGAFVTSYNDGNRITVQEALMLTDQEWYR